MSKEIILYLPAKDEQGVQRSAGQSFTCSDRYAAFLVNNNTAAYTDPTAADAPPVSGAGTSLGRKLSAFRPQSWAGEPTHLAAPDWASGSYTQGMSVKNGGKVYLALGSFTSSAAPTGVLTTPMADPGDGTTGAANNKGWVYQGPSNPLASTEVTSWTGKSAYPTTDTPTMRNFGMLALANARGLKDPAALRYIDNGGGGVIAISGQRDATTYNAGYAGVSFITDEDLIAIDCGSGASPIPYVDGVRVIPGMIGSAASRYKYLTFANRRMRRIRFSSTDSINEIYVKTATTAAALVLQPDTAAMSFDTLWVGDSYTAGAAPGPSDRDAGWANLTAKELGIPAPVMCATGGTGWMTAAGVYDYLQRLTADLAYHAARNYDLIVLTGSGNDLSGALADNAAYRTQVQTILALCRSFAPNAYIAVTGINNGDFNTLGAAATLNTMLSQEVATFAAADTNRTFFIPFSQDMPGAVPFFNLVNKAYYIGTTDQHPFDSGHYAMAKYTADRIRGFAGV